MVMTDTMMSLYVEKKVSDVVKRVRKLRMIT